ncbi:MAG: energy transducer TonB [Gemmatimonadales bacterium]
MHAAVFAALIVSAHRSEAARLEFQRRLLEQAQLEPKFLVPPNRGSPPLTPQIQYMAMGNGNTKDGVTAAKKRFDKKGDFGLAQVQGAQEPPQVATPSVAESTVPDKAFSVLEVDSAAVRDPNSAAPSYPPLMRMKGIEGFATLRFVIDTTGVIDMSTVTLVDASHAEFVQAVREAMPKMRFRPAMMGPTAVRQLAEQPFKFEIKHLASGAVEGATPRKPLPLQKPR